MATPIPSEVARAQSYIVASSPFLENGVLRRETLFFSDPVRQSQAHHQPVSSRQGGGDLETENVGIGLDERKSESVMFRLGTGCLFPPEWLEQLFEVGRL